MKGSDIATLRNALGLDQFGFAAMLGVHVSAIYRWEGKRAPKVDGVAGLVLERLLAKQSAASELADLGEAIRRSLLSGGGTLGALGLVICFLER